MKLTLLARYSIISEIFAEKAKISRQNNFEQNDFKNCFALNGFAFLVAARLHWAIIKCTIREETLKTFFAESFVRTDVPLLVRYDDVTFTFLIEHQHDPDAFSIHHLARYVSYLEEQHKHDIVPIVYFSNASAKSKTLLRETKSAFMGKRYHYFTYEAVFLKDKPAKKYLKSNNIIARLLLPFMRYSKEDWLEVLDSAVKAVLELVAPSDGLCQNKYLDFLAYYFNLDKRAMLGSYAKLCYRCGKILHNLGAKFMRSKKNDIIIAEFKAFE